MKTLARICTVLTILTLLDSLTMTWWVFRYIWFTIQTVPSDRWMVASTYEFCSLFLIAIFSAILSENRYKGNGFF